LAAVLPVAVGVIPGPSVRAAEPAPLRLGMPESMFSGLPPAVVQVGAQPFKDMFEKQTGLKGEVSVTKDYAETTAQLRSGKLDVAVYHGFEYAWVREHDDLIPLMIAVPGNKIQACLVVNVECKATGPKELKGACVAVPKGTKAHCHLYLDRLKANLPADSCCTAKLEGNTIEDALDAVAGGRCESALVDVATLAGYQKNKPGVGTQLKILDQSLAFPPGVTRPVPQVVPRAQEVNFPQLSAHPQPAQAAHSQKPASTATPAPAGVVRASGFTNRPPTGRTVC
jgi:ABC-type phosphate/phosphonate transport system substrate-binding protein